MFMGIPTNIVDGSGDDLSLTLGQTPNSARTHRKLHHRRLLLFGFAMQQPTMMQLPMGFSGAEFGRPRIESLVYRV
jgi:hypothetical protein